MPLANDVVSACSHKGSLVNKFEKVSWHGDPTYPHGRPTHMGTHRSQPWLPTHMGTFRTCSDLFTLESGQLAFDWKAFLLQLNTCRKSPSRPQTDRVSAFWALFHLFFCRRCSYFHESITWNSMSFYPWKLWPLLACKLNTFHEVYFNKPEFIFLKMLCWLLQLPVVIYTAH